MTYSHSNMWFPEPGGMWDLGTVPRLRELDCTGESRDEATLEQRPREQHRRQAAEHDKLNWQQVLEVQIVAIR